MNRGTLISLAVTAALLSPLTGALAQDTDRRVVSVSGSAEVRVQPDQVILTLGIESLSEDLVAAKADNDRRVQRVIKVAKRHGVADAKIATDFLQIQPDYGGHRTLDRLPIYVVQRSVVVTMAEIARFEDLLSDALAEGANYVHGIDFRTTELRRHRDAARKQAIRAAHDKAALFAEELDLVVGEAMRVQEGGGGWWSSYGRGWGSGGRGFASQNVSQADGQAEGGGALSPGEIAVTSQVAITFALQ